MIDARLTELLPTLWPQIIMGIGACVCLLIGLSPRAGLRANAALVAAMTLIAAGLAVWWGPTSAAATGQSVISSSFVNMAVVVVGLVLLLVAAAVPEQLKMTRDAEARAWRGETFEPGDVMRGEFFAFFLLSLTGVMLCGAAGDLVWLFLALELTSLPTYVMVAISRDRADAQEAAVKYFFLGAMAAAMFLYGFALIYGVTGYTRFDAIADYVAANGVHPLLATGFVLAIVGIGFKIAAVPMHFYAADVYQGAAVPVTAFLAFVPKTAGFLSIVALVSLLGWPLDGDKRPIMWLLWIMAALTMCVGNVLALLQSNVKRVLAYSSIAHSGYILVGVLAGPALAGGQALGQGVAAVLFYLVAYGLATIGAFAVLGCLRSRGEEAQSYDDIAGLASRQPGLAAIMLFSVLSLLGLPPMVGFLGKIYLFGSAIEHGFVGLVVVAVVNSAVSAVYYLRIAGACYFGVSESPAQATGGLARRTGAGVAALAALVLGLTGGWLVDAAQRAGQGGSWAVNVATSAKPQAAQTVTNATEEAELLVD